MDQKEVKALKAFALRIRLAALDAIHSIGSGHVGGALSIADALAVARSGQAGLLQGPCRPRCLRDLGPQGLLPL